MKRFFTISLLLVVVLGLQAQKIKLSGKITDNENNPLPGAAIQIKNTFLGTTTNQDGVFEFNLKEGDYILNFSFIGYKDVEKTVKLNKDLILNVQLEPNTVMTDEVIVKATRANENTPVVQTTINKKDIAVNSNTADIPFQLEMLPSVVATSENGTGMGYTAMRIRGTDMSRINVTMNGIPVNDAESQGVYFVNMPDFTASVNSIQVQRGVGTSTNGAASFGGSINFQTLTLEPKPYAILSQSVGSFNTFKESISAGTGLLNNKFAFDVRYSKLNSDGYIDRGFSDHQSFYFSGTYYGRKDMLKAVILLGKEKTGITWWGVPSDIIDSIRTFNPAGEYYDKNGKQQFYDGQTDNYWQNHYQLLYSRELSRKFSFNAALHATTGKGYYQQYKTNDNFSEYGLSNIIYSNDTISSTDLIRQKWLDNLFYGFTSSLNYNYNKFDVTLGIAGNKYDGDHFGNIKWMQHNNGTAQDYQWYKNNGTKTDFNTFLKVQYSLNEKLSFYGDVQYRKIQYKMQGPDDDLVILDQTNNYNFVNPKFGVNYKLNNSNTIYATFGIANREPTRTDIKDASKNGGKTFPMHETLYDYELGYQITKQKYALGVNIYYMDYKNQLVSTGELNSVGYPIMTNVDNSYRTGVEFIFGVKPIKNLEWIGNITVSKNIISNYVDYDYHTDVNWNYTYEKRELGNTNISYSPELIGASTISYTFLKSFTFNFISKYVSDQYIDNTMSDARKLDAYFINNVRLDFYKSFDKAPNFRMQFLVNNIFNVDYISNAYGGKWYETDGKKEIEKSWVYYYPQAGVNFMIKLALEF